MKSDFLADALQQTLAVGAARKRAAEVAQHLEMQRAAQEQEMGIRQQQADAMAEERAARSQNAQNQAIDRDINLRAEALADTPDVAPDFNGPPAPDAVNAEAAGALPDALEAVARARAKARRNALLAERGKGELQREALTAKDEADARKEAREEAKIAQGDRKLDLAIAAANRPRGGGEDKFDTARFNAADKLRDDFVRQYKPYADVGRSMNVINTAAADPTGAKDIALVTTFMKMLDPGSTVRESEFATAQNTGALWERLKAQANAVASGQKLTQQQRTEMAAAAKQFADSTMKDAGKLRRDYEGLAKRRGLDPGEIMLGIGDDQPAAPSAPSATSGPAVGTQRTFPNGRKGVWDGRGWKPLA